MFIDFDSKRGFEYRWCGKFTPPSDEWIHMTRNLVDYELMVVTEVTQMSINRGKNKADVVHI